MVCVNYDIRSDPLFSPLFLSIFKQASSINHGGTEGRLAFQNDNKIAVLYLFI
jgi:hypothetical protein